MQHQGQSAESMLGDPVLWPPRHKPGLRQQGLVLSDAGGRGPSRRCSSQPSRQPNLLWEVLFEDSLPWCPSLQRASASQELRRQLLQGLKKHPCLPCLLL